MRSNRRDFSRASYFQTTPENKKEFRVPKWIFVVICVFLAASFALWFFLKAPWLQVKDIRVEGTATEQTRAEIEKLRGKNILWLSFSNPENAITAAQPSVKQIEILRGIPDTLRVKLIEREAAMIWQVEDRWYTVDPTGFIFKEEQLSRKEDGTLNLPSTDLPVVTDTRNLPVKIGDSLIRPQFIVFVKAMKERIPKEINVKLVRAEVGETTFNVTAITDAGWSILFDTTRKIDPQMKNLVNVYEAKKADIHEYIDLRVRGWVYYK